MKSSRLTAGAFLVEAVEVAFGLLKRFKIQLQPLQRFKREKSQQYHVFPSFLHIAPHLS